MTRYRETCAQNAGSMQRQIITTIGISYGYR